MEEGSRTNGNVNGEIFQLGGEINGALKAHGATTSNGFTVCVSDEKSLSPVM